MPLLEEFDSWSSYIDDYNDEMRQVAYWLTGLIVASLFASFILISHGQALWGLVFAGSCGAFVSVISKLPTLTVIGGSVSYRRGIWRRVSTGIAASVIGTGLLLSGIVALPLPNGDSVSEMITACSHGTWVRQGEACTTGRILVLAAISTLLGLSERAVTSFEEKVFSSKP